MMVGAESMLKRSLLLLGALLVSSGNGNPAVCNQCQVKLKGICQSGSQCQDVGTPQNNDCGYICVCGPGQTTSNGCKKDPGTLQQMPNMPQVKEPIIIKLNPSDILGPGLFADFMNSEFYNQNSSPTGVNLAALAATKPTTTTTQPPTTTMTTTRTTIPTTQPLTTTMTTTKTTTPTTQPLTTTMTTTRTTTPTKQTPTTTMTATKTTTPTKQTPTTTMTTTKTTTPTTQTPTTTKAATRTTIPGPLPLAVAQPLTSSEPARNSASRQFSGSTTAEVGATSGSQTTLTTSSPTTAAPVGPFTGSTSLPSIPSLAATPTRIIMLSSTSKAPVSGVPQQQQQQQQQAPATTTSKPPRSSEVVRIALTTSGPQPKQTDTSTPTSPTTVVISLDTTAANPAVA